MIGRFRDPGPVRGGGKQAITAEWANRMRDCIVSLYKQIPTPPKQPTEWLRVYPWEVTANGDDTLTVADGSVIYFTAGSSNSVPNSPFTGSTIDYSSASTTITASGTLYAVIEFAGVTSDDIVAYESASGVGTQAATPTNLTVELDPTLTGDKISIPIATVTLTDSVAKVTKQILNYNPTLDFHYVDVAAP